MSLISFSLGVSEAAKLLCITMTLGRVMTRVRPPAEVALSLTGFPEAHSTTGEQGDSLQWGGEMSWRE